MLLANIVGEGTIDSDAPPQGTYFLFETDIDGDGS